MDAVRKLAASLSPMRISKKEGERVRPAPSDEDVMRLKEAYTVAGQGHVFTFWSELGQDERTAFYEQLSQIDPARTSEIFKETMHADEESKREENGAKITNGARVQSNSNHKDTLEPLPESASPSLLECSANEIDDWREYGLNLVAQNKVGVVLMAGGQGTRLGFSGPKGCFDIGLKSRKSLFQLQAERIAKLQQLAGKEFGHQRAAASAIAIPWYIMTSGPTHDPTVECFEEHAYFGLQRDNVHFFPQGTLPCFANDGKILLESKGRVAVSPDGNGGIYKALITENILADARNRGVEHIHCYCVDNCLVRVADPVFIGFAAKKKLDIATKVVRKRTANESVGLVLLRNGKPDVVEYSEIDAATAEEKDAQGRLRFRAANIVNHYFSMRFLDTAIEWHFRLPHHIARKKIACVDLQSGKELIPNEPNGNKLEQFVFDVFPLVSLQQFACMEVERAEEFSPLKNAAGTGTDDPDTSRAALLAQGRRWLQENGVVVSSENADDAGVEISPLLSYAGEGLSFLQPREIRAPALLELDLAASENGNGIDGSDSNAQAQ